MRAGSETHRSVSAAFESICCALQSFSIRIT